MRLKKSRRLVQLAQMISKKRLTMQDSVEQSNENKSGGIQNSTYANERGLFKLGNLYASQSILLGVGFLVSLLS